MKATQAISVVVVSMFLLGTTLASAQDWPQWRGADRDGKVVGFTAPEVWPEAMKEQWKVTVGAGSATPALVDGKLYVTARQGGDEVTLCLNANDGKEIWRDKFAVAAFSGPDSREHSGPRCSPAVADGKVVTLSVDGVLSCLNTANGEVAWRKSDFQGKTPRFHTSASPVLVDGMAIAYLGAAGDGAIVAYDLATGAEKWKWAEEGPDYSSPVLLTVGGVKQVVTLTEKSIVGVGAADGKLLWRLPFAISSRAYNAATPIVDGDKVIYMGSGRGVKTAKIEKDGNSFTAKELWSNPDIAPQFNTPVLKDGLLFGQAAEGNLFCLDAATGKTTWTDAERYGRGFAAVVDAGSVLLALPSTSELIAFKPNGEKYEQVAKIKVADTPTYAHPVVAGKQIFIKSAESLALLTFE